MLGFDAGGGGGLTLRASAGGFDAAASSGSVVARLNRPFGAGTVFSRLSGAAQLGLVGGEIRLDAVSGGNAPVAGSLYTVKVRARNADDSRAIEATLSFRARPPVPVAPVLQPLALSVATLRLDAAVGTEIAVTGKTAGSVVSWGLPGWLEQSPSGHRLTVRAAVQGADGDELSLGYSEALDGASNTPRTGSVGLALEAAPVVPPVDPGFRYQPDFGAVAANSFLPVLTGWALTTTQPSHVGKVSRMATTTDNTLLCTATTDSGWNGTAADLYDHDQTHGVLQFTVLVRPTFAGRRLPPIIFSAVDGWNWCGARVYYDGTPRVSLLQFIKCVNGAISIVGSDIPISGVGDVTFRIRRDADATGVHYQIALPNGATLANDADKPIAFGAGAPFGDRIGFASEIYVEHRGEITNYIYAEAISGPAGAQAREAFPDWTMQTSAVELALPGSATFAQPQMRMLSGSTVLSDWQAAAPYQVIPKTDEPEWRILGPAIPSQYHEASVMLEYRDAARPAVVARSAIIPKALPVAGDSMVGVNSGSYQDDNAPLNFVQTMLLRSAPTAGGSGSDVCHPQYVIDKAKTGALPASDFGITDGGMKIGAIPAGRNLDLSRDKSLMPRDPNDWLYKNADGTRRIHRASFTPGWYLKLRGPSQSAWVWSDAQGNPAAPNYASGLAYGYFRHSSDGGAEGVSFMLDHFDENLNNAALPNDAARNGQVPPKANQYFRIVDTAIDWAGGRWTNPEANKWLAPFAGTVLRTMSAAKGWGGPVPQSLAALATGAQPTVTDSLDYVVWNYYNNVEGTRGILAREVTADMEFTRDSLTWAAPNHVGIPVEAFIETANDFNMHLWPCDNNVIGDAATTARAQKYDAGLNVGRLVFAEKINEGWNPYFGFSAQHINYLAAKFEGKDTAQSVQTTGFPANHLHYVRLANASFDRYKAVSATRFKKILLWQHAAVTQSLVDAMLGAATDRDKLSHFGSGAYNYGGNIGEYGSTVWSVASKDRLAGTAEERAASEEAAWQALEYTLQHVTLPSIVSSHRCLDDWKRRNPGHDHIRSAQYEFSFQHSDKREAWPSEIDAQAIDLLYRMQVAPGWVRYGAGWYAMLYGLRKMGSMLAIYSGPGSVVSPGNVATGRWGILSSSGALNDEPYASIRRFMADHRGYQGAPQ